MTYLSSFTVDGRPVGLGHPTYFIADIASNHDGDLGRARALIELAAEAGADAVKFQHFLARDIVSDRGFRDLAGQLSHQETWAKPVYEVYAANELPRDWTAKLADAAKAASVTFMTSPYDFAAVEHVAPHVSAFKIGSGDITWTAMLERIADQGKPVFLASGASTAADVERAVATLLSRNPALCLMQCNTNYTGSLENFRHVNLRVLETFARRWPGLPLGLSDHTPKHATVLGAVALGARVIEKHFTDDTARVGPDHLFSMDPATWRDMVERTRELEAALGDGVKRVEDNERDTVVVQRRALRLRESLPAGARLQPEHLEPLRPAPSGAFTPSDEDVVIGRRLAGDKHAGDALFPADIAPAC